jgi:hypothetical protein
MFSLTSEELHRRIHDRLPADIREAAFEVDVAALDARPHDPASDRYAVLLYDPLDGSLRPDAGAEILARLPVRNSLVRVFTLDEAHGRALRDAAEEVIAGRLEPAISTNT